MNQTIARAPAGIQRINGQNVHWGNVVPEKVNRKSLKIGLTVMGFALGISAMFSSMIPILGQIGSATMLGVTHLIDRVKNQVSATDDLTNRARLYTSDIRRTLTAAGMKPERGEFATVDELRQAAKLNKALMKIYQAPIDKQKSENRTSALTNGAIATAGLLIPGGAAVAGVGSVLASSGDALKLGAEVVKVGGEVSKVAGMARNGMHAAKLVGRDMTAGLAGGALATALGKSEVDVHELSEAMTKAVADGQAKGLSVGEVLSPNLLFTLRVAQDTGFAKHIDTVYGKPFHQMDEQAQAQVMQANQALLNSVQNDIQELQNIKDPQQLATAVTHLGATEADLSQHRKYNVGEGFVGREMARRNAPNDPRFAVNANAGGSFAARLNAQRAAMSANGRLA